MAHELSGLFVCQSEVLDVYITEYNEKAFVDGILEEGEVNYPPLMRGVPHLEVGASAPWSLSFPAYEESSLQDDCNHPNLTISTGDPRRPVRFIHNEGLSFLCVRMSGCACHPFRLIQDILCCLLVPVHGMSAHRAEIRPVGQL